LKKLSKIGYDIEKIERGKAKEGRVEKKREERKQGQERDESIDTEHTLFCYILVYIYFFQFHSM
jgi:hypothetical protein